MLLEKPLDYYQNDLLISFNNEFIGIYYDPENNNMYQKQQSLINRSKVQKYIVNDDMSMEQLRKKWYDNNKESNGLHGSEDNYVIMWKDQFPLYDYFTIATVKEMIVAKQFDDLSLFKIWYEWDCPYKKDQAALAYDKYIQLNQEKHEITLKICSPNQQDNLYFYLPCGLNTEIKQLKKLIQVHFQKIYSKTNINSKYRMLIKQSSLSRSFKQYSQKNGINIKELKIDKNYIDITDCQAKKLKFPSQISKILAIGQIMQLKFEMNLNISSSKNHKNDPLIKIQCLQRQSNQSNSIIKKLSIQKRFSQIQQLKVETLLSEYSIEDAHFTSLYWDNLLLRPEEKFQNLINLKDFQKLQEIVLISIPENLLYYKEIIELEKTKIGKSMKQILEIISDNTQKIYSQQKQYKDKPVKEAFRQHINNIRTQRLSNINEQQYKNEAFLDPLILYTSQYIYQELNKYLRENSISRVFNTKSDPKSWHYPFCEKLLQSLMILHNYQGKVYRGSINFDYDSKVGQIVEWNGFNSTSKDRKKATGFLGNKNASLCYLFQIDTYSGKQIDNFSFYQKQSEVVILPYTRFQVLEVTKNFKQDIQHQVKQNNEIKTIKLTKLVTFVKLLQIPIPKKIPGHIVVWIDSNIKENFKAFQKIMIENKLTNYDLIQLRDNDHFKVWLKEYRQILSLTQANVHFISNMNRPPFFKQQGIETLQIVRSFQPDALVAYYIGNVQRTMQFLKAKGKDKDQNIQVAATYARLRQIFLQKFNKEK